MKSLQKHKFIFVAAIMTFVFQTGCAGEANANFATQMPSNQTSQTADNTVVPRGTDAVNATSTPLAVVPSPTVTPSPTVAPSPTVSPTVSSPTQGIQNIEMNLTQIQTGDYSSLLGNWTEVAYADNLFDGTGQQWHVGTSDTSPSTLSVSTDKIVFNDLAMVVQGNTLTDDAGSHLLSFVNNGSSLDAELADVYTTINWSITFYPKGVENDLDPNNGVKIDNTKNLIVIWHSGMQVETVFAQN